jgi:fluoride exporter
MIDIRAIVAVMLGGGIGSVARYVIGVLFVQRFGPGFPYGTLFINVAGSLAIGIIAQFAQTRALGITPIVRLFLAVGVLGGFTTFSTFAYEAVTLTGEGVPLTALLYIVLSVGLGTAAAFAGAALARFAGG